jgi:hypothetical protein
LGVKVDNQTPSSFHGEHSHLARNFLIVAALIIVSVFFVYTVVLRPQSSAVPARRILLNGTVTVNSGSYWYLQFVVPPNSNPQIHVSGNFTASGGSGNDIRVYVMSESSFRTGGFPEWGKSFNAYYDSRQVTAATFSVELPSAGTYYLVFDNIFSDSQKKVDAQVNLSYYYTPD